jgi:hypothetical protein
MGAHTLKMTLQFKRDTAENWLTNKDVVPAAGEPCYDLDAHTLKIGDGVTTYENLIAIHAGEIPAAATHYEGVKADGESDVDVIARVLQDATVATAKDDIFIVKTLISNDKYSHTAYVYDGAKWIAMDGNYNAENVYFDEDFTFTTKIGTVQTLTNGSATKAAAGKNLKEFLASLFAAEQNPSKTDPSVSVTLADSGAHEVGTVLNPTYTASFEDGKYTYGPEPTGATVTAWAVTSNYGESWDTATGTCEQLTVADDTNYTITASVTHTAGSVPKTNLSNDCTDTTKQIASGTKSKTSSAITGYRSYFYGVLDTTSIDVPLTSAIIRDNLTNGGNYNEAKSFTLNGSATAKRIVVAIPSSSTRGGLSEVILTSAMNTPVTDSYTKTVDAVKVEGKDGFTAADYDVYVYEPSKIDAGEVHAITLA